MIEALIEKSGAGFRTVTIRNPPSVVYVIQKRKDFVTRLSEIREFVLPLIVIVEKIKEDTHPHVKITSCIVPDFFFRKGEDFT